MLVIIVLCYILLQTKHYNNWKHLEDLTHFSIALKKKLNYINQHSFNSFQLRVGEYVNQLLTINYCCYGVRSKGHRCGQGYNFMLNWCSPQLTLCQAY